MAIVLTAEVVGQTRQGYEGMLTALQDAMLRAPGFILHSAYPVPGGWRLIEVWDSAEDAARFFDTFVRPNLPAGAKPERSVQALHRLVTADRAAPTPGRNAMPNKITRRQAIQTVAATGVAVASASLGPAAVAQASAAPQVPFASHRSLENSLWFGPHLFSFLADAASTGGAYTLIEASSPPGGVIGPHVHSREDEIVYVIEGQLEITLNGVASVAGPGEHRFLPRGNAHGFRIVGDVPLRALVMFTPAGLEGAYRQVARPAERLELPPPPPPPTPEARARLVSVFAAYGYTILPPKP